jgi:hypothetical protein
MNIDDLIKSLEKIKEEMTPEEREMKIGLQSPMGLIATSCDITKSSIPLTMKMNLEDPYEKLFQFNLLVLKIGKN